MHQPNLKIRTLSETRALAKMGDLRLEDRLQDRLEIPNDQAPRRATRIFQERDHHKRPDCATDPHMARKCTLHYRAKEQHTVPHLAHLTIWKRTSPTRTPQGILDYERGTSGQRTILGKQQDSMDQKRNNSAPRIMGRHLNRTSSERRASNRI